MRQNYKIIEGSEILGGNLRLPRAISIYKAACSHKQAKVIACRRKADLTEIIILRLMRLDIPDMPEYPIMACENVAICCKKDDLFAPEVYALRKDFPLGLPHSNVLPFSRPVSLCVSDVPFQDIRPQFNAFDFINYIIRWFNLNSLGELHEKDRPLEIFFQTNHFCGLVNEPSSIKCFGKYVKQTKVTSTLEFVEKRNATHYVFLIGTTSEISNSLPFLPQTIGELNSLITDEGRAFLDTLIDSIWKTDKKSDLPFIIVLGVQNRDDNHRRTDWAILKTDVSIRDIITQKKRSIFDDVAFMSFFSSIPVTVELLLDNPRKEINASQNGKVKLFRKVACIGTGTIGSNIIDHIVREGIADEVCVVDFDILGPHNISRHILPACDIMKSKVKSLKRFYSGIANQKFTAIDNNYLNLNDSNLKLLYADTDLIIDASTSIAVERVLALSEKSKPIRKCTVYLNPKGTDLVLMMEDKVGRQRLDLLEMSYYYNLITKDVLALHLDTSEQRRTNCFSCRSESNIMDYDNIGMLASVASQQIQKASQQPNCQLNIWKVDKEDSTISKISMDILSWDKQIVDSVSVYCSTQLIDEIGTLRKADLTRETGGCLFGCYDKDAKNIYIFYQHHAPSDSKCSYNYFERGCNGMLNVLEQISKKTYHQVRYLGEWHSHPNANCSPSSLDKEQLAKMSEQMSDEDLPFVQLIMGTNGIYLNAIM